MYNPLLFQTDSDRYFEVEHSISVVCYCPTQSLIRFLLYKLVIFYLALKNGTMKCFGNHKLLFKRRRANCTADSIRINYFLSSTSLLLWGSSIVYTTIIASDVADNLGHYISVCFMPGYIKRGTNINSPRAVRLVQYLAYLARIKSQVYLLSKVLFGLLECY